MTAYIKSKKISQTKHNQGIALLSLLIILAIFGLGFLYLWQTNDLVNYSYQIREKKEKYNQLKNKNKQLEMEIAAWQSPAKLEEMVKSLDLTEEGEVVYLELEGKTVAFKE